LTYPLNRLLTAGDQTHWSNSYVYDAWGNLYQKNPGALPGEGMSKVPDTNNHLSGLTYDAGGNVTNDGPSEFHRDVRGQGWNSCGHS
jgi:YD repeat-containing protein